MKKLAEARGKKSDSAKRDDFLERKAGVFYLLPKGDQKYVFEHIELPSGGNSGVAPFFGVWFCGNFPDAVYKELKESQDAGAPCCMTFSRELFLQH